MAIIIINYNEGGTKEDLGYKNVELSYTQPIEPKLFATGSFVKDWFDMRKFIIFNIVEDEEEYYCHSSSVNHFITDGAPFDSAYLHIIDENPVLKYFDRTDPKWYITQMGVERGVEFFVPENTQPTWEELKEMCK